MVRGIAARIAGVGVAALAWTAGPVGGVAHADGPVLGGGSGIMLTTSVPHRMALCTLTAIGYDREDKLVGITAGHCAENAGVLVGSEAMPNAGPLGFVAVQDAQDDWAVIEFDPARVTPVRQVGPSTLTGIGASAAAGEILCKNGRTTGFTCGVVWNADPVQSVSQICAGHGDSGGPVLRGAELVGMVNGGISPLEDIEIPCTGPGNPIHEPTVSSQFTAVLEELNRTGARGSGFRPL
ncbi:trypsin-like serine protease [Nocardia wallacei]|uniref:trypsin-like serine protease n=1 Tax=Nocardia wallacei TaxID=480035 RepID=UPI0024588778|nr:trypsin-like serine protease [Nocardia wallacei]